MLRLKTFLLAVIVSSAYSIVTAQSVEYTMPIEDAEHEGTWIQWPHNELYGPWYMDDVEPTFVAMAGALQSGENVHIIAKDNAHQNRIINALGDASIPLTNIDFFIYPTDDVWSRDNGPIFVYDQNDELNILDWGFNGWGGDAPYANCDVIPASISTDIGVPRIDLNAMVLEGGAIEHDGAGTVMATRSSITDVSRNPGLTEAQIEDYMTTYLGFTNFIWLDGVVGADITDMHIDGFVKFADANTIVTMNSQDLDYWAVTANEIQTINNASNANGDPYTIVTVPLTQNDVSTTYGSNLGYKGSYCNYYIGNDVVLVPTYNDPNDAVAINIIQALYPNRTTTGVDVRNLYEYGGMIHCVTQQQPVAQPLSSSVSDADDPDHYVLRNHPNPFSEQTTVSFDIARDETATIDVFNTLGEKVASLNGTPGKNTLNFNPSDLDSGIYIYSLKVDSEVKAVSKMIVN